MSGINVLLLRIDNGAAWLRAVARFYDAVEKMLDGSEPFSGEWNQLWEMKEWARREMDEVGLKVG
jgi:hypothetical protein